MSVMLLVLASLLLFMAVGGGLHMNSVRAEETIISNTERSTAYLQTMLSNTHKPSAIPDLLTSTNGNNDRVTKHDTDNIRAAEKGKTEKNYVPPFLKSRKLRTHAEKSRILGKNQKIDDQKFLFYGQAVKNENKEAQQLYGPTTKNNDQKFLFYGKAEKNEDKKVQQWYGPTAENGNQKFLFYGKEEKNDDETTKSNMQDDGHEGESGHIHGGITAVKNEDQEFLFYKQANHGVTAQNNDQKFLFYGQSKKNDGEIPKSNVQVADGHKGEGGHIHGGVKTAEKKEQNFLFYGQWEKNHGPTMKNNDQQFLFYGQAKENHGPAVKTDDERFLFYGQAEKNDDKITKSNVQDDAKEGEGAHIHGGMKTTKNNDHTFLFYGKSEKKHVLTAKTDDQSLRFYGQSGKNNGEITKSNVQGDAKEGEGGYIHGGATSLKNEDQNFLFYGEAEKNHGPTAKNDDQIFLFYGQAENKEGKITKSNVHGDGHEGLSGNINGGITATENDEQNFLFYGQAEENHGLTMKNGEQKFFFYGQEEKNNGDITKSNVHGDGPEGEGGHIHGGITTAENDDQKFLFYGQAEKNHGSTLKNDDQKFLFYGQAEKNNGKITKSNAQDNGHKGEGGHIHGGITTTKNDGQNFLFYGQAEKNDREITKSNLQGNGHKGEGGHNHGSIMFSEDILIPGSTITPYIQPSFTLGASLPPRHVADSIPMSTRSFTDMMALFAPASYAMAEDIRSSLALCDHPPRVKGETDACVVSLESMVEFVSSVLGTTHGLRALSSSDVPAGGVASGQRYKMTKVRRVTEAGDSVTCHGLRFPVALFICHAVNPTRLYSVTLEREPHGGAGVDGPERMEVLVVCHLDTADFNPMKMPENVKPGQGPVCHFIARDNLLWAPSAAPAVAAA